MDALGDPANNTKEMFATAETELVLPRGAIPEDVEDDDQDSESDANESICSERPEDRAHSEDRLVARFWSDESE